MRPTLIPTNIKPSINESSTMAASMDEPSIVQESQTSSKRKVRSTSMGPNLIPMKTKHSIDKSSIIDEALGMDEQSICKDA